MEYILQNTKIFDKDIDIKFFDIITTNRENFINQNSYKMIVSFHVNLLKDRRFQEFDLPSSKVFKNTRDDKITYVMSYQLDRLEQVLKVHEIKIGSATIQGDCLGSENIIKIEIIEDNSKSKFKSSWILPSKPYQDELISKLVSEHMTPIYNALTVKNPKFMSDVLEIEETEDESIIFRAFVKKYIQLWLGTAEEKHELLNLYHDKLMAAYNKHSP